MWDEEDQFFYDVLHLPHGGVMPLKLRSMVGLIPLFAVETLEPELLEKVPDFKRRLQWYLRYRPELAALVSHWNVEGRGHRRLLSLLRGHRTKRLFSRMLDETEFLSDFGVRAISKFHEQPQQVSAQRHGDCGKLPFGRIRFGCVWRKLQLARPDLVAGELPVDRIDAEISPLLWR